MSLVHLGFRFHTLRPMPWINCSLTARPTRTGSDHRLFRHWYGYIQPLPRPNWDGSISKLRNHGSFVPQRPAEPPRSRIENTLGGHVSHTQTAVYDLFEFLLKNSPVSGTQLRQQKLTRIMVRFRRFLISRAVADQPQGVPPSSRTARKHQLSGNI